MNQSVLKGPTTTSKETTFQKIINRFTNQCQDLMVLGVRVIFWPYQSNFLSKNPRLESTPFDSVVLKDILAVINVKLQALDFLRQTTPPEYYDNLMAIVTDQFYHWLRKCTYQEDRNQFVVPILEWLKHKNGSSPLTRSEIALLNRIVAFRIKDVKLPYDDSPVINLSIEDFIAKKKGRIKFNWPKHGQLILNYQKNFRQDLGFQRFREFRILYRQLNQNVSEILFDLVMDQKFLDYATTSGTQTIGKPISKIILLKLAFMDYLKSNHPKIESLESCQESLNQQLTRLYGTTDGKSIEAVILTEQNFASGNLLLWEGTCKEHQQSINRLLFPEK